MTQIHFIINPCSGGNRGQLIYKQLKQYVTQLDKSFYFHETTSTESIEPILLNTIDYTNLDKLIIVGGDGTLHHVVSILQKHHLHIPIAYIGAGTGNDFSRSMFFKNNVIEQLNYILNSAQLKKLPILLTDYFYSINSFGFGLDALVCLNVEKSSIKPFLNKWHFNSLAYIIQLIKSLFQFKRFSCTLNDRSFSRVAVCTIMNNPFFGGGIHLDPLLNHSDDTYSIIIVHDVTTIKIPSILWALVRKKQLEHPCVYRKAFQTSQLLDINDCVPLQVDGEVVYHVKTPITIQLHTQLFWV